MPEIPMRSGESRWRVLVELRSRKEIVQRWLQTEDVPDLLREQLRLQLEEIDQRLARLEKARGPAGVQAWREAG